MKKVFIVAGEVSGDKTGAWYLKQLQKDDDIECEAVGGLFLEKAGAKLYAPLSDLNAVGIVEIISKIPYFLRYLKKLSSYILQNSYDEIVLVDFPGFNMRLVRLLKKKKPELAVTYCAPPQLWVWGAWRVRILKKYVDKVVVLYPFEVEWYKKRGVQAQWSGYPGYEQFRAYGKRDMVGTIKDKKPWIAIVPASRGSEAKTLFPLFAKIMHKLKCRYSEVTFVIPIAESFSRKFWEQRLKQSGFSPHGKEIRLVEGDLARREELSQCAVALSKPGTVTLELALLGVPTVIVYKTSFLTYHIAKLFVKVPYMGLPNLFLQEEIFPELIQKGTFPDQIFKKVQFFYDLYRNHSPAYEQQLKHINAIHKGLM